MPNPELLETIVYLLGRGTVCGKCLDPIEDFRETIHESCGTVWRFRTSDTGEGAEIIERLRPDLRWLDYVLWEMEASQS